MKEAEKAPVKSLGEILKINLRKLPDREFACPKHGSYSGKPIQTMLEAITPECPICKKEKEAIEEAERQEKDRIDQIVKMNIDERYWNSNFENFNAYNEELKKHLRMAENFAGNPDGKLVMLGENGNGKTHLAISVLKKLGGKIYTAYEIGVRLRQSYTGETKEWEILNELCTVPLLVIDEVEKIKDSESKQNWVSHVVGKRCNRRLPIIFIANCHTKADCKERIKPCSKCLEYHLENDVISRIVEDGLVMKFTSEDYRKRKGEEYRNKKRAENANNGD
jgi:DNA replication protein DnaC